ncbi:DUF1178 family protein [Salipiger sp. IMCC34102]|uniref:DUF1178 family protein n=1 Tax=Salipiger sp. IMCC34102 TaxID=2510647 RepID=UPI00101D0E4D|nr:DUF1178 family protein [Salipiger sp. IMCC34102]RYH01112.1 DUF1178 family protein [Salipiger sp. IMCC34102]
MIRYTLQCDKGHRFDSWFASSDAFDTLRRAGHLSCETCGSTRVDKSLMAPRIATEEPSAEPAPLEKLRRHVESTATYVGGSFAEEARDQHDGTAPARPIYGEATGAQVRALLRDEVPVLPLPFRPKSKTN